MSTTAVTPEPVTRLTIRDLDKRQLRQCVHVEVTLVPVRELVSEDDTRLARDEAHVSALTADFRRELAEHPDRHPVQTPLRVRRRADGRYLISAGNYRYQAALRVPEIDALPCIVLGGEAGAAAEFEEMVRDNRLHRPYTPVEDARNVCRVMELRGCGRAEAGRRVGITNAGEVTKLLRVLNDYPEDLHPLIGEGDGRVPFTTAYALARLKPDASRQRELTDQVVRELLTRDAAETEVQKELGRRAGGPRKIKPVKARTARGLAVVIATADCEVALAELGCLAEAVKKCQKHGLPLSALPQVLKSSP